MQPCVTIHVTCTGIKTFMDSCIAQAKASGGVVTLLGRRRPIPGLHAADAKTKSAALRKVVNSTIQVCGANNVQHAQLDQMCHVWACQYLQNAILMLLL